MSINKNLITGHDVIVPPVNTSDVSIVTRRGSNDVGTLCGNNPMINMWAKYKPVRWGGTQRSEYNNAPFGFDTISGQWDASASRWKTSQEMTVQERYKGVWWKGGTQTNGVASQTISANSSKTLSITVTVTADAAADNPILYVYFNSMAYGDFMPLAVS